MVRKEQCTPRLREGTVPLWWVRLYYDHDYDYIYNYDYDPLKEPSDVFILNKWPLFFLRFYLSI